MSTCPICRKVLKKTLSKYCSNKCQSIDRYQKFIENWRAEVKKSSDGIVTKNISKHIKRYLLEKFRNRCSICGWDKINPITQRVPLEVDHIDGDSGNNKEQNLRLICPNCHSLSSNFRNLNKGKGRVWRRNRLEI